MSHSNISSGLQWQEDEEPPCPDLGLQFGQLLTVSASELRDLFPDSSSSYDSSSPSFDLIGAQQKAAEEDDDDVGDSEEMWPADSSERKKQPRLLGGLSAVDDTNDDDKNEEDGFRTPTGPEHRIPEPKECPSRPTRARRRRRVPVVSKARRRIQLDLCKELDDFPSQPSSSPASSCCCEGVYGEDNRRNKRARTDCSSSN